MSILFSCFNHMEGILHTCSHISFQNKYTSTSYCLYYRRMFQSIDSQPCQGTQEALHTQATTYAFRRTIFTQNMYSKDSTLTYCCPSSTTYLKELCTAVSEHDFAFMSNTCCAHIFKGTAQNDITSWKDLVLCQECYILETKYCMRHILEGLKRNVRGHAETCLLIIFSSRGCVVFSPIFLSNFLGGCPNHEK